MISVRVVLRRLLVLGVIAIGVGGGNMFFPMLSAHAAETLGIAVVVNEEAISASDVQSRMRLVLAASGLPASPEMQEKIAPQVLEGLIEDSLKLQEAKRNKIVISDEQVDEGLSTIASQNKLSAEQFSTAMKKQGVPISTLESQIRAQLAWNEVIKTVYRRQVNVTETDVDNRLERLKTNIGKTEYLVSEIFLPFDGSKRQSEVMAFAGRMASELQAGRAPFGPVAAQFSKAAGAERGGTIGWVQEGQLDAVLEKVLLTLNERQISNPIKTQNGVYILLLGKKRTLAEETLPSRQELRNQIGFERLDRVQQRALFNLKSIAFIDRRM